MANSMYSLMLDLRANVANLQQDMNKAVGILENSGSRISRISQGIFQGFGQALGQLSIQKISALSDAIGDLAAKGERTGSIADGFRKLGGTAGTIDQASRAVRGMVSEFELMRLANENIIRGLPDVGKNFVLLAEYAGRFANSTGRDTVEVFEQISEAITEASAEQLQKFGLAIDASGDKVKDMEAALALLPERIAALIPVTDSVANAQTSFNTALSEAGAEIGQGINASQELADVYNDLAEQIRKVDWKELGQSISDVVAIIARSLPTIQTIVGLVNNFATGVKVITGNLDAKEKVMGNISDKEADLERLEKSLENPISRFVYGEDAMRARAEKLKSEIKNLRQSLQSMINEETFDAFIGDASAPASSTGTGGTFKATSSGAASKAADELKKAAEAWKKVVEGLDGVDLKESIQGSIESVDEATFKVFRDKLYENSRQAFIEANAENAKLMGVSQTELAERAQQHARQQVATYDEAMQAAIADHKEQKIRDAEEIARREAEARQRFLEYYGLDFSNANTGGLSDILGELGNIFGDNGQLSNTLGQFSQQLDGWGRLIFDSSTFLGNSMTGPQAHAAGIQGPMMENGMFGSGASALGYGMSALQLIGLGLNASNTDRANQDNSGTGALIGGGIGGAVGIFGGPVGVAIGMGIGQAIGGMVGGLFKWGSQDPDTQARHQFANYMEEKFEEFGGLLVFNSQNQNPRRLTNFIEGSRNRFNTPGWADSFNQNPGAGTFSGLGLAFNEMLELPRDIGEQIGAMLFDNLEGSINNARMLMKKLNLSFEEVQEALMEIGKRGEKTWLEIEVGLQGASEAFKEGLVEVGNYVGAMQMLLDTGGRGYEALHFIRTIAIEAKEAGIENFEQLREYLLKTFDPATVDAFFDSLENRKITSLDQLASVDDRTAGGLVADMDARGAAFKESADTIEDATNNANSSIQDATRAIKELSANIRGQKFVPEEDDLDVDTEMASGGVLFGPKRALMGEAGPEAIIPLTRKNGKLGVAFHGSMGGGGGGNTIVINAQGAAPGVEHSIRSAIREAEERAVARVYRSMNHSRGRGV